MAIAFARCEYVQRSEGADVCLKSAYNERGTVTSERTGQTYSFVTRGGSEFHEIMLPMGANEKFKDGSMLWNAVDKFETRKNARLAKEFVLALPDDKEISLDDRIELCRRFANKYFVEKGVAVQIDIHAPHHETDKNWHAHLLVTTRRFDETGMTFCAHKARDLDGIIRKGMVIEADLWGEYWRDIQNEYFAEKGLKLRVDEIGIIAQEHLGPVRMRKLMSIVTERNELTKEANAQISLDPEEIIKHLTRDHAAFNEDHLDNFLEKHVPKQNRDDIACEVLSHSSIVRLFDKETREVSKWLTTKDIRAEEERVLREAEGVNQSAKIQAIPSVVKAIINERSFSEEQKEAFEFCVTGEGGIKIIQGRAGTGKSYVMQGIREAYERSGATVVGLGYTGEVAKLMHKDGFEKAYTMHSLVFLHRYNRIKIQPGTVFVIDEASMAPTTVLDEVLKVSREHGCKIILVGDDRQQDSRARSGMFTVFAEKFGSVELKTVRRQAVEWQRSMSESLSSRAIDTAIRMLQDKQGIQWHDSQELTISALVEQWCKNSRDYPDHSRIILAHRNIDVDFINESVHRIRQALNKVSTEEIVCETKQGKVGFSVGDRVQFTVKDKDLGLNNGEYGTLVEASLEKFQVQKDDGEKISFNPSMYKGLRHWYATTIFKAQGKTIDEVFVLHSSTLREKASYVALTRQVKDVQLFVSKEDLVSSIPYIKQALEQNQENPSKDFSLDAVIKEMLETNDDKAVTDFYLGYLIKQMSRETQKLSSLNFHTFDEIKKLRILAEGHKLQKLAVRVENTVKDFIHKHIDKIHQNADFYKFEQEKIVSPLEVTKADATERWNEEALEEAPKKKDKIPAKKTSDKTNTNIKKNEPSASEVAKDYKPVKARIEASVVEEALKKDIRRFAIHLLGEPDKKLSTGRELVFRKDGKVSVNLDKGVWKDFKNDTGGNLFKLIQREQRGEFKDALAYAAAYVGLSNQDITRHRNLQQPVAKSEEPKIIDAEKAEKAKKVQSLYKNSLPISGTLGEKYLRTHRAIQGELSPDIRFSPKFYNTELKQEMPALLAFARDKEGIVKACQAIYLDKNTANKAEVSIAKKTFGVLTGSFVEIQKGEGVAYIAEGVETALSVKEIGLSGTIVASLGIQNIKHFDREAQSIVICADNDGQDAPSRAVIEKSVATLEKNGYTARIIEPQLTGEDFNDVLKKQGREGVAQYFGNESRSQKEVYKQYADKDAIQKTGSTTEVKAEVSSSLTGTEHLNTLAKQYRFTLSGIYREMYGPEYKNYKEEISTIAARTAKDVMILGEPKDEGSLRVLLSRNHYEISKSQELQQQLIKKDPNFVNNWMKHAFKAEAIASIGGRIFATIRAQKDKITATELKNISKQAHQEFEGNVSKLQAYIKEANKEMRDPHMAKMYAEQRVMFEERYGIAPSAEQLKVIKEAVSYGHNQYKTYQQEFTDKIISRHGSINEATQLYVDQAAKYKAYTELKEIIPTAIACGAHTLPSIKDLKAIEVMVEKSFRSDKQHYEQLHDQQKEAQQDRDRQNSRGFER